MRRGPDRLPGLHGPRPRRRRSHLFHLGGGNDIPELHPAYVEKYGGPPNYALFGEDEEAFAKVRAGYRPDVAHPCKVTLGRFRDAGLIKPIDVSRLPEWPNVWDELKSVEGVTTAEGTWHIPFDWGNASVLYRTDLVDPKYIEEESWELLSKVVYGLIMRRRDPGVLHLRI